MGGGETTVLGKDPRLLPWGMSVINPRASDAVAPQSAGAGVPHMLRDTPRLPGHHCRGRWLCNLSFQTPGLKATAGTAISVRPHGGHQSFQGGFGGCQLDRIESFQDGGMLGGGRRDPSNHIGCHSATKLR